MKPDSNEYFHSDAAILSPDADQFQRLEFSRRIANIINSSKNDKSLVIGLYGKWGEGKTSIMNLINRHLDKEVAVLHFNPWLFSGEENLLKAFFENLAGALGRSLKSKKEKIGELLSDYAGSVGVVTQLVGVSTEGFEKLGNKLRDPSIEKLKTKLDALIIKSEKNITVFIDDIDRLDIQEIRTVFKLVKLVGDFPRTSYVLAFDDETVARALAPQYGGTEIIHGFHFLEKIIQIPLKIPKANPTALRQFTLTEVDKVLNGLKLQLAEQEEKHFIHHFNEYLQPELENPRLGIRYSNSLSFSIPLLTGEVYTSDLMIVEGIKIFYPEFYAFLRNNANLFVQNPSSQEYMLTRESTTKEERKKLLEEGIAACYYHPRKAQRLLFFIQSLFPQLKGVFGGQLFIDHFYSEWYRQKRICSAQHFSRYFSYVVNKGDISDVFFDELFSGLDLISVADLIERFQEKFKLVNSGNLINKLRHWENTFTEAQSETLVRALAQFGSYFYKGAPIRISFETSFGQAAIFISRLLNRLPETKRLSSAVEVIDAADTISFAFEIKKWLMYRTVNDGQEFEVTVENEDILNQALVNKFKSKMQFESFFNEVAEFELESILLWWSQGPEKEELFYVLRQQIARGNGYPLMLLKIFTPTTTRYGGSKEGFSFKTNFTSDIYNYISGIFDPLWLYDAFLMEYGDISNKSSEIKIEKDQQFSDDLLVSLFQKYHKDNHANSTTL